MFKVPKHLSREFSTLSATEKEKFVKSYRVWYTSELTQALIEHLTQQIQDSVLKEEQKSDFSTLFESKYHKAKVHAERTTMRKLLNTLNPEME